MSDQPDDPAAADSSVPGPDEINFDSLSIDFGQEWTIGGDVVSDENS